MALSSLSLEVPVGVIWICPGDIVLEFHISLFLKFFNQLHVLQAWVI